MRKALLIVLTALMAGSVSAQPLSSKRNVVAKHRNNAVAVAKEQRVAPETVNNRKAIEKPVLAGVKDYGRKITLTPQELKTLQVVPNFNLKATRRAGTVQPLYNGYGSEYGAGKVEWTMTSATTDDNQTVLVNVVPSPFSTQTEVPLVYTQVGDKVTVAPQLVYTYTHKTYGKCFVYAAGGAVDGSIEMTIAEDGSISVAEDEQVVYGVFANPESEEDVPFDPNYSQNYLGYYQIIESITYLLPGQKKAPSVAYEPSSMLFNYGYSYTGYGYNNALSAATAFAPLSFKNYTTDEVDTWSWTMNELSYNAEIEDFDVIGTQTGNERDFTATIGAGTYAGASLVGSLEGLASVPYVYGTANTGKPSATIYTGISEGDLSFTDGSLPLFSLATTDNGWQRKNSYVAPSTQYDVQKVIMYQGKPSSPLYIKGVNMMFYKDFVAKDGFTLKCQIVKCERTETGKISLGDVIAESDVDATKLDVSEYFTMVNWSEFYVEDEFGLSTVLDHLFIEDEFAIVIDGWSNGTFSGTPIGEANFLSDKTYTYFYGDPNQTGTPSIYSFTGSNYKMYVGFTGWTLGYLHTTESTDLTIPAEGGTVAVSNIEAMYCNAEADETGSKTRLFLDDTVADNEIPEWLAVGFANEAYTDTDSKFDLVFQAEALPEGVTGRQATLVFYQEGAQLKVTVTQGEVTGIAAAKAEVKAGNAQMYNIAGQRVSNSYKGLVIKNGKKMLNK